MEKWHVISLLIVGFVLLLIAIFLRARFGEKFDLRTIDLVLIILPLLLVLLVSGKLKVFDAFGIKADFSELFANAADTTIELQIDQKGSPGVDEVVNMLQTAAKGGVREIPTLIENKTEALVFQLGHGGYYGPAIEDYFDALYASSFLQYLIITDQKGALYGIYDVLDLSVHFRTNDNSPYKKFAQWLNDAGQNDLKALQKLPGCISADQAVGRELSKRKALEHMDSLRVDSLPVIDKEGFFVGTVERAQLTASLILDVVSRLDQGN
jgi:hypothetical protein